MGTDNIDNLIHFTTVTASTIIVKLEEKNMSICRYILHNSERLCITLGAIRELVGH